MVQWLLLELSHSHSSHFVLFVRVLGSVCFCAIEHMWEIKWGLFLCKSGLLHKQSAAHAQLAHTTDQKAPAGLGQLVKKAPPLVAVFSWALCVNAGLEEHVGRRDVSETGRKRNGFQTAAVALLIFTYCWCESRGGEINRFFDVDDCIDAETEHNPFLFAAMFIFLAMSRRCIIIIAASGSGQMHI